MQTHPDPQDAPWPEPAVLPAHLCGKYFRQDGTGADHPPRQRTCPQCGGTVPASVHDALPCAACVAGNAAATPQPPPHPGHTMVLPLVIADLEARAAMGRRKYGTDLMVENGRDHLIDAYQEALDLVMYLCAAIERRRQEAQP